VMTGWISGHNAAGVVASNAIARPEDFIGKTVATQRGSGSNYHMVTFLAKHRIPLDKVTIKFMAAPDQLPALARDDIQSFFSWEPYVSRSVKGIPGAKIFTWAIEDGIEFRDNIVMREDFAKGEKETAIRVVKGLIETADWMQGNLHEAAPYSIGVGCPRGFVRQIPPPQGHLLPIGASTRRTPLIWCRRGPAECSDALPPAPRNRDRFNN